MDWANDDRSGRVLAETTRDLRDSRATHCARRRSWDERFSTIIARRVRRRGSLLAALVAAWSPWALAALANPEPAATLETVARCGDAPAYANVRRLLDDGFYREAELQARGLLAGAERTADSLCMAEASDLLAEALLGWSGASAATPLTGRMLPREALERAAYSLRVKESALGTDAAPLFETLIQVANAKWHVDRAEAHALLKRALAVGERSLGADHPRLRTVLASLSQARLLAGDTLGADSLARHCLALCESRYPEDHPSRIRAGLDLAGVLVATGRSEESERPLSGALRQLERDPDLDHPEIAIGLAVVARRLVEARKFSRAWPLYERSIAMLERRLPDSPALARVLVSQAWHVYTHREEYERARGLFERSLRILESHPGLDPHATMYVLRGVAWSSMYLNDYTRAEASAGRAIAIHDSAGLNDLAFLSDFGGLLQVHAYALNAGGDPQASRRQLERRMAVLEARQQPDHSDWIVGLGDLGNSYYRSGDYAKSRALFERALELSEKKSLRYYSTYNLMHLARVAILLGDTAQAIAASTRCERIHTEDMRSRIRTRPERDALRVSRQEWSTMGVALTLAAIGVLNAEWIREIWDVVIGSRAMVLDEMTRRHRDAVEVARRGEVSAEVVARIASLAREAAVHAERLSRLTAQGPREAPPAEHARALEEARERKERAEFELAEASDPYRRTRVREAAGIEPIIAALPPGSALVAYHQFPILNRHDKYSSGGYMWGDRYADSLRMMTAYVLRGGERDPILVPLGRGLELDSLVARWGELVSLGARFVASRAVGSLSTTTTPPPLEPIDGVEETRCRQLGEALRRRIWDPLLPSLRDVERVYLVPDGALHLVNWAALPVCENEYLVETGPLLHVLSAERDLLEFGDGRSPNDGLLALGNPDFDQPRALVAVAEPAGAGIGGDVAGGVATPFRGRLAECENFRSLRWESLPETARECSVIVSMWGHGKEAGGEVTLLLGSEASEDALKAMAAKPRVLHLATHGFFVGPQCLQQPKDTEVFTSPMALSGLTLAGANRRATNGVDEEDGVLTAEELGALDLGSVEWVVLSACETGVGQLRSGEGVLGLRRAVRIAGARTLIMSLWSVEDEATRAWMTALYEARLRRGRSTAEAVRDASRAMLASRRALGMTTHPFYWGAFVAVGDWR